MFTIKIDWIVWFFSLLNVFKLEDFFGRVKNKAGDMEKILKEKDKHGLLRHETKFIYSSLDTESTSIILFALAMMHNIISLRFDFILQFASRIFLNFVFCLVFFYSHQMISVFCVFDSAIFICVPLTTFWFRTVGKVAFIAIVTLPSSFSSQNRLDFFQFVGNPVDLSCSINLFECFFWVDLWFGRAIAILQDFSFAHFKALDVDAVIFFYIFGRVPNDKHKITHYFALLLICNDFTVFFLYHSSSVAIYLQYF